MRPLNSLALALILAMAAPALAQLPAADHAAKRQTVLNALADDGIIFVEGSGNPAREDQTFMQSRDFQALTGVMQPGSALVMWKKGATTGQRIIVPPKPAYSWDGEQMGPAEAAAMMGIPALPTTALQALLDSLDARNTSVYLLGQDTGWPGLSRQLAMAIGDSAIIRRGPTGGRGGGGRAGGGRGAGPDVPMNPYVAITQAMRQARAKKTDAEIALLKKAAEISVEGHKAAMRMLYPGVNESEIRGVFEGTIFRLGAERIGYPSIVGTGANATYLHYSADTMKSKPGEVVVMDAAAIYRGYSADVTRTFPVSGRFSPQQRIIYEAVYNAQSAAAKTLRPGSRLSQADSASRVELWKGLAKAGLVDSVGAVYLIAGGQPMSQLSLFLFHGISHGLGLNVHDPIYTENGMLVKNSIFVLEPGLYVRPMTLEMVPDVPENAAYRARLARVLPKYLGIGTRIEDDFVITDTGSLCLSCGAPRSIAAVEAIAGKNPIRR